MEDDDRFSISLLWDFEAVIGFDDSIIELSYMFGELGEEIFGNVAIRTFSSSSTLLPLSWLRFCSKEASVCIIALATREGSSSVTIFPCPLCSGYSCTGSTWTGFLHFCASVGVLGVHFRLHRHLWPRCHQNPIYHQSEPWYRVFQAVVVRFWLKSCMTILVFFRSATVSPTDRSVRWGR